MKRDQSSMVIPFYGGEKPELFEIERRCMDRDGIVIQHLDEILPTGSIIDVGAGNGFTAEQLNHDGRTIVAMEPDEKMVDHTKNLIWSDGVAQQIPFHTNTFNAMYSTWAFFFQGVKDIEEGLVEVERVVRPGGMVVVVDNYGDDEFCSYSPRSISSRVSEWTKRGFDHHILHTEYRFDSVEEAQKLLTFYFGDRGEKVNKTRLEYKVVVYTKEVSN